MLVTSIFSFSHTIFKSSITLLNSSETKKFTDNNLKFDENGRIFSERFENTVGKGEIDRYEESSHFPRYFQKTCSADM